MKEKKQNQLPQEKKTILIVEDEYDLCEVIANIFVNHGYLTISAHSVEEGWDIFKKNKLDLVMTDIVMPGLLGYELIDWIRNEDPNIPIIGISGYHKVKERTLKMGADEFLEKSIANLTTTMLKMVGDILSESELERLERKINWYKYLADTFSEENKILKEKLEYVSKSKAESKTNVKLKKEVEKYNAVCGEVAHNLKSEFMHIGHSLNEIRETAGTSPEIVEECNMIERSLAYSRFLMLRLLNFLEMGSLQREPIELKVLIQKIEELTGPRLPSNIRLQIHIPAHLDKTRISGNFEQLMAIFLEFINNASRVLRSKGGIIEIEVAEKNDRTLIFVNDNGPGIPRELRNKIVKEKIPSKNGGLGMGLFLSGKVIKEFNGELQVETEDGKGTTFTISFPTLRDKRKTFVYKLFHLKELQNADKNPPRR